MDESAPRFSLVAGEGDGAILGLAAGDTAGGSWELGYSAHTEQATVVAYHLIENGRLHPAQLLDSICELDGSRGEAPVYRAESPQFRSWLDSAAAGSAVPDQEPSIDAGPRAVPLGVVNRRDPLKLVDEVIELGALFHTDAITILGGGMTASAVAASCFGQSGRDLIAGVHEAVETMGEVLTDLKGLTSKAELQVAVRGLGQIAARVGVTDGEEALAAVGGSGRRSPWDLLLAGLLLAAPLTSRDHLPIEQAARIGGSGLGAVVGAIIGARVGIKAWPWPFANDTWFAEIGRRLVRGPAEVADLPIPYSVENHLMSGDFPIR